MGDEQATNTLPMLLESKNIWMDGAFTIREGASRGYFPPSYRYTCGHEMQLALGLMVEAAADVGCSIQPTANARPIDLIFKHKQKSDHPLPSLCSVLAV